MTTESTARSVRKATISLGLVSVPVKLYTTCESASDLKLSMLHEEDGAQLKQQYVCTKCGVVVDKEHTARGHEHAPGQFVVITKAELEALESIDDGIMTIREFIRASALDPLFVSEEKSYYLGPDKGADMGYALMLEAMEDTNRIAIATYSRDGKERLVALRPFNSGLMIIHELRYATEIRGADGVPVPSVTTKPQMLSVAREIIDRMSADEFVPEKYSDTVTAKRRQLILQKIENGESITVASAPTPANVTDMLEALRASLDLTPARSTKRVIPKRSPRTRAQSVVTKARAVVAAKKKRKAS